MISLTCTTNAWKLFQKYIKHFKIKGRLEYLVLYEIEFDFQVNILAVT